MNRERTAAAAAVMLAYAQGQTIQTRRKLEPESIRRTDGSDAIWRDVNPNGEPLWCWHTHEFRIKPVVVKSRRYLACSALGRNWVGVTSTFDADPKTIESRSIFVRWIDPDWVETEL